MLQSMLVDKSIIGLYFWVLFFGYYIFGIIFQGLADPQVVSHFSDYRIVSNEVFEKSLIFVALFVGLFNIRFSRFSAALNSEKVANTVLIFFAILAPLTIFDFYARSEILATNGYIGLYQNYQTNIIWNFFLKYLPQILIFLFLASNTSPRRHIICIFFLTIFIIQLLMTGQRTTPVLLLIINAVVYSDMYLNRTKRVLFNGSILVVVFSFALAGLAARGGSIANIADTLHGFSKPYDEILVTLIAFEKYHFLFQFDFSPLFPSYSYFCDFGSLLLRDNLCVSELRFLFQGMQGDWLSLSENSLMYLGGGTSGGGFIASLLAVSLISQSNIIIGYIFFALVIFAISNSMNYLSSFFGSSIIGVNKLWIFRYVQLYFWSCVLFSISGSISSLIFGSRMILYSLFVLFSGLMIFKIGDMIIQKNRFTMMHNVFSSIYRFLSK
jgi:hypothetical protein